MKKAILIFAIVVVQIFGYDCSMAIKHNNKESPEQYCRQFMEIYSVYRYDRLNILSGIHISKIKKRDVDAMIIENAEECYQTCLKKNKRRK